MNIIKPFLKTYQKDNNAPAAAFILEPPVGAPLPVLFNSPHSGRYYPPDFLAQIKPALSELRHSEDSYIEQLFSQAPKIGASLLYNTYSRNYVDTNRAINELDIEMFKSPMSLSPIFVSKRVTQGYGVIPRLTYNGKDIYKHKLQVADVEDRLLNIYTPVHHQIQQIMSSFLEKWGIAFLIDCHSMPCQTFLNNDLYGTKQADIVLGDRYGASCAPWLMELTKNFFEKAGLSVAMNNPFAGGFNTYHYGQPAQNAHVLQIEINRGLYMDENDMNPSENFFNIKDVMTQFMEMITTQARALLIP